MTAGRPSKYSEEMLKKAQSYADNAKVVPSAVGLAVYLDVSSKTLYNWAEAHPEFLQTLDRVKDKQHLKLIENGLSGEFNQTITKLMLANHGYSDKIDATLGAGEKPVEIINVVSP